MCVCVCLGVYEREEESKRESLWNYGAVSYSNAGIKWNETEPNEMKRNGYGNGIKVRIHFTRNEDKCEFM